MLKKIKNKLIYFTLTLSLLGLTGCSNIYSQTNVANFQTSNINKENESVNSGDVINIDDKLNIYVLDVGQGSSCLIECNNEYMLIDAGENDCEDLVCDYLNQLNVDSLKYVIGTHPDSDHIGGLDAVINNFDVETIFLSGEKDTKTYDDVINSIKNKNLTYLKPSVGDIYELGESTFTIIGPNEEYSSSNDNSICLKLSYKEFDFITTGDAEIEAEKDIVKLDMNLNAEVYNAGHHGSSNASSETLLDIIKPDVVTISVGDNNYGHPHKETLDRFEERNIEVYRTDELGVIHIVSDGQVYDINKKSFDVEQNEIISDINNDNSSNNDIIVYKTKTGSKYHKDGCDSLSNSKIEILEQDAINEGLEPCKKCNP